MACGAGAADSGAVRRRLQYPAGERAGWQRWWLVDPLDGTKEFIAGSEEFTVNIALIENGEVVFGVVSMPTNGRCYFGGRGLGAWRADAGEAPRRSRCATRRRG
jgi:3'(2'), 5'-bisphosphate nucleotidase